jgi:hypothetical protein
MTEYIVYAAYSYCAVITAAVAVTTYFMIKFSMIIIKFQEEVEKSLEVLDERYASISKILEIPLFFDSPEIRRVVDDVNLCRNSILQVAKSLGNVEEEET